MTDENDDKQRRERSRRRKRRAQLERAGTKTTAAKKPDLTWLGLDWTDLTRLGLWDGQHAIWPPERASQRLSMEPQCPVGHGDGLEIMDQGLTDGPWLVAFWRFFFFFVLHSSQAFLGSPLSRWLSSRRLLALASTQSRPPIRIPIAYPRRRSAHPTHSFQVPATLGPVKPFRRPPWDSLFSSNHPPTVANHQQDTDTLKHALPPLLIFLSVLVPPLGRVVVLVHFTKVVVLRPHE